MPKHKQRSTRDRLLAAALELMEGPAGADGVTMRSVATAAGVTTMATYKHFPSRDDLLRAATAAEYPRIAAYFARANAKTEVPGMRGMLGYLDYALDHPQVFRYMFAGARDDAFAFPSDLEGGKSPTFNILLAVVTDLMERQVFRQDDVAEVSLGIWSHAHGLISLYLSGRIEGSRAAFQELSLRSLNRLVRGLAATPPPKSREPA